MPMIEKHRAGALLDTHVWIWLNEGSSELKPKAVAAIDAFAENQNIFISPLSIWEIGTLVNKKRLILQTPLNEWVKQALSQPGIELLPFSSTIAVESTQLPGEFHGDPADRIITASARIEQLTLITRDQNILRYGKQGYVDTFKV